MNPWFYCWFLTCAAVNWLLSALKNWDFFIFYFLFQHSFTHWADVYVVYLLIKHTQRETWIQPLCLLLFDMNPRLNHFLKTDQFIFVFVCCWSVCVHAIVTQQKKKKKSYTGGDSSADTLFTLALFKIHLPANVCIYDKSPTFKWNHESIYSHHHRVSGAILRRLKYIIVMLVVKIATRWR